MLLMLGVESATVSSRLLLLLLIRVLVLAAHCCCAVAAYLPMHPWNIHCPAQRTNQLTAQNVATRTDKHSGATYLLQQTTARVFLLWVDVGCRRYRGLAEHAARRIPSDILWRSCNHIFSSPPTRNVPNERPSHLTSLHRKPAAAGPGPKSTKTASKVTRLA